MTENYNKLFTQLTPPELPDAILKKIMNRIEKRQRLGIVISKLTVFSLFFIGAIIALFPALNNLRQTLATTGFLQYFSLIFSDLRVIVSNWSDFSLTLLETLPVFEIIICLGLIAVMIETAKLLAREIQKDFLITT